MTAVDRFLPETERTRRSVVVLVVGAALAVFVWWAWVAGPHAAASRIALVVFGVAAAGVVLWRLRQPRRFVEVDLAARTWTVFEDGRPGPAQPLDSIGPLVVSVRRAEFRNRAPDRMPVATLAYAVHPEGLERLDVAVERSRPRARLRMKALARRWGVAARSLGGDLCAASDLDRPLHERLRGHAEARAPMTLDPAWRLSVEPVARGFAVRSRHRDWTHLRSIVLDHASLLGVLLLVLTGGLLARARGQTFPGDQLALAALAAGFVGFLGWTLWRGIRDSFLPGAVHVTGEGVSYRGARIALDAVQEVVLWGGVEVVGDGATLTIPPTFYPSDEAARALAHEVRRLIVDVGGADTTRSGPSCVTRPS